MTQTRVHGATEYRRRLQQTSAQAVLMLGTFFAAASMAAAAQGPAAAQDDAPAPQAQVPADTVVAERGGVQLRMEEIDARMALMPPDVRAGYLDNPERIEQLILNMLLEKQLAQFGREAGLHEKRLFDLQAQQAVNRMLGKQAIEHHLAELPEPDFEALAYERYLADNRTHVRPERRNVTQVLITTDGRDADAARALAERVREEALAGEPFEALVAEYNEGNPASGKLEGVVRGQTVPTFEDAVFAMQEPGEISEVIESRFGFHVVRLEKVTPESKVPFTAVRDVLVKKLREDYLARESRTLRDRLNSMKLDADPDAVASLRSRYRPENTPLADYDSKTATDLGAGE